MTTNSEEILKKLRKRFETLAGKKFSDDELLEKCFNFLNMHMDELIMEDNKVLKLTPELRRDILLSAQNCELYDLDKTDDELIYGI